MDNSDEHYTFVTSSGQRAYVFENLYFHKGGVLLEGNGHNVIDFLSCGFTAIPDYAIKTAGSSVVGVRILNCEFAETAGGVGILHNACDLWIIGDNSKFVRLSGLGVECHSSGVSIRDAQFESKQSKGVPHPPMGENTRDVQIQSEEATATSYPHIRIEGAGDFAGGICEIIGCRFGGEVAQDADGPPEFAIQLGPSEPASGTMTGIFISRNRFLRRGAGGPNTTSGHGAIRLTKAVKECVVIGNHFQEHAGPLVCEDYPGGNPRDNYFTANAIDHAKHHAGIFSRTGDGWIIQQTTLP
jgi:hypothetical protein